MNHFIHSFHRMWITAALVVAVIALVAGCATGPTPTQQSAVAVAVNIAAGRAIQRNDTDPAVWKTRASAYKVAALRLQTVNDAGTATVATLVAEIQPLVAKLGPADQLAAQTLIAALTPFLQEQANASPELATARDTVARLLTTFIAACDAYGA